MTGQTSKPADAAFDFKRELVAVTRELRAYAHTLAGQPDVADDLVQEALMKAWAARHQFKPGTNFRAWTVVILRNCFYTSMRRRKFTAEYDELAAERILSAPAPQPSNVDIADVQRGLMLLPAQQREALILVGAGGFSYEEAAQICGCALGTLKSRVSRARTALEEILEKGTPALRRQQRQAGAAAFADIIDQVDAITPAAA